jgi:hypothetical protein
MSDRPVARIVVALGWLRRMDPVLESGGSEPHLFATTGGNFLVKASNNPQGLRVLVNELVGGLCLDWIGVNHPSTGIVTIAAAVIAASNGGAQFNAGGALAEGESFGSEFWQSDPGGSVSADLIINRNDVAGVLAFDTWIGAQDGRQYRVRASADEAGRYDFIPVDQGHSLGAPGWDPPTLASRHGSVTLGPQPVVPVGREDVAEFVERLKEFDSEAAQHIVDQIPPAWCPDADKAALTQYLVARAPTAAQILESRP